MKQQQSIQWQSFHHKFFNNSKNTFLEIKYPDITKVQTINTTSRKEKLMLFNKVLC